MVLEPGSGCVCVCVRERERHFNVGVIFETFMLSADGLVTCVEFQVLISSERLVCVCVRVCNTRSS